MARQEELEEKIREAEAIPGFREFLEQQMREENIGDIIHGWSREQRELKDIAIDNERGVAAYLFQRSCGEYDPTGRYCSGLGASRWIDVGVFTRNKGALPEREFQVNERGYSGPDLSDPSRQYDRVEIVEVTDDRVRIRARADGRSDEFDF